MCLQTVSERAELPIAVVDKLAGYHANIIRKLKEQDLAGATAKVILEINDIAKSYSRATVPDEAMQKMVKMVLRDFAYLAPDELQEAYRMWAAKKITVEAEMYGGQLTPQQLGAVLDAYSQQHRKYQYGPFLSALEDAKTEQAKAEAIEAKRAAFDAELPGVLSELIATATDWRDVPEYLYHVLKERGDLPMTSEQAHELYDDAAQLVIIEENERIRDKQQRGRIFEKLMPRETMQKTIARKLAVFRFYVLPKQQ